MKRAVNQIQKDAKNIVHGNEVNFIKRVTKDKSVEVITDKLVIEQLKKTTPDLVRSGLFEAVINDIIKNKRNS